MWLLRRRIANALRECELQGGTLLVAVSGGGDSLALLHALHGLRDEFGLRLRGAHLNHNLRGAASDADAEFVAAIFKQLGVPCTMGSADVAGFRRTQRLSLEDAARRVRYGFLVDAAVQHGANAIAVGHTADDQAESVLMHIIRGSGLTGLRGMQTLERRSINSADVALFRPLLSVSRSQTLAFCDALGLQPRHDASNMSTELMRSRIRNELMPLLEQFNPSIREALMRLSQNAATDSDYIQSQVDSLWACVVRRFDETRGVVTLDTAAFNQQHAAMQSHLLRRAIEAVNGSTEGITQSHVHDMARLMAGYVGKSLNLPDDVVFTVGYGEAYVGRRDALVGSLPCMPALNGRYALSIPGETQIDGWVVNASICDAVDDDGRGLLCDATTRHRADSARSETAFSEMLDLDCVGDELWVRSRVPGDRFQPLGMLQPKKLQDFMVDARIPRRWRDGVPLVVSERGIVCVGGWRIAHWARITDATKRYLHLRFQRMKAQG